VGKDKAYSPDLNPIEKGFRMLKAYLRSAAVRTVDGLIEAMGDALRAIRPGDLLGWFRHSGDKAPPSTATLNKKPL
jgi:transposase